MSTSNTELKIQIDVESLVEMPQLEDIEFEEISSEEQERIVRAAIERNAEVLSGLAKR